MTRTFATKKELAERLMAGEKWRLEEDNDYYFFYDEKHELPFRYSDGYEMDFTWAWEYCDGVSLWILVEPKKTVTIEKWLCRNNGYFIVQGESEYLQSMYPLSKVKLLSTEEIEL